MTPTKAAMRAAEELAESGCSPHGFDYLMASIIDRETGLPELVAALRKISDLGDVDCDEAPWIARAALARVDSPEPVR